jgi:hypothetical protein
VDAYGTLELMTERPEPDIDRVRDAMRKHDERQEDEPEQDQDPPAEREDEAED